MDIRTASRHFACLVAALMAAAVELPSAAAQDEPVKILTEEIARVKGPKRIVAVGNFEAVGAFKQEYSGVDIGAAMGAMMTSALRESGRFIVLERANIQQILSEQELKAQKLTAGTSGPQLQRLIGAHFLVYGAVTEFGSGDSGSGFSLGASGGRGGGSSGGLFGGGGGSLIGAALSHQSTSGKIGMDVRIVDTTTSEVLETYTVAEEISGSSFDVNATINSLSAGHNSFAKTPLGEATRKALTRAVQMIARKANDIPWSGQVVELDKSELYISGGSDAGMKTGDRFGVERIIRTFTDPTTGKIIGVRKQKLGEVVLTGVEPQMGFGTYHPAGETRPQRGDLVIMTGEGS